VRSTQVTPSVVLSADRPGVRRPPRWKRTEVHRIRAAHAGSDPREETLTEARASMTTTTGSESARVARWASSTRSSSFRTATSSTA